MLIKLVPQPIIQNTISRKRLGKISKKSHPKMQIVSLNWSTRKKWNSLDLVTINLEIQWKTNSSIKYKEDIGVSLDPHKSDQKNQ